MRRPLNDIVADIIDRLQPLKPDIADPAQEIRNHIGKVQAYASRLTKWDRETIKALHDRALKAADTLAVLGKRFPWCQPEFSRSEKLLRMLAKAKRASDPRTEPFDLLCAYQAAALVEQLSQKRAVSTENGNAHLIAQLIFEAVKGRPPSTYALLRSVRQVIRSNKEYRCQGKRVVRSA